MIKFIKFQECRSFISQMLEDKNIAMISSKARIISAVGKHIVNNENEKALPEDLIKILNKTHIDTNYLKKDMDSFEYRKKQVKKRLYKEKAFEDKK